ncbi:MAG TPA: ABC transporter permease [Candidatus Binataceae bacterium]|nr:ABC transporter permease [Candidatus Binataceae bacterium]
MMKYAFLVAKNLMRSKRRTLLTISSIAVSIFVFAALSSVPAVARQILGDTASSLRIACHNKAGLAYPIPEAYRSKIVATPHVVAVVAESWFGGIYHDVNDQFPNLAVDPEQVQAMWPDWGISDEAYSQFTKIRTAALVGPETMKRFRLHVGQQVTLRGTYYPFNVTLNIVGVMGGKSPPNFLLFRRDYLSEAAHDQGTVDNMWVRVDQSSSVPEVIASLDEQFANSPAETQSESEGAFLGNFMNNYKIFFQIAQGLGLIVIFTIGLVAANTAAMSIRERRAEIVVMRAIGFTSRTILALLLAESMLIALLGGIIGCGTAYALFKIFSFNANVLGPFGTLALPTSVAIEALGAAATIGFLSAFVPARSAAQRNIVEGLRAVV